MNEIRGHCGTLCNECSYKEKFDCKGCIEMKGKLFWGECDIYNCSNKKGFKHCGYCSQLPCENLKNYIKNGHNTNRMSNLLKWKDELN